MLSLIQRFTEPSSWAGLSGILTPLLLVFGVSADPGLWTSVGYLGAGVAGVLAVLLKEKSA